MSMQISKGLHFLPLALCLAACNGGSGDDLSQAEQEAAEQAALAGKVECALAGTDSFERICTTEQIASEAGNILVIRHPDGGFRRFDILTDGRGLAPADGFDETRITLLDKATGQRIPLESFGPTNSAVFAQLQWARSVQ